MKKKPSILKVSTYWIVASVVTAFVISTIAVYILATIVSKEKSEQLLANNIEDLSSEITEADSLVFCRAGLNSSYNMEVGVMNVAKTKKALQAAFAESAQQSNVPELFYVDQTGVVTAANNPRLSGFDMHSTAMARPFLRLLSKTPATLADSAYATPLVTKGLFGDEPRKYIAGRLREHPGFIVVGLSQEGYLKSLNFMLSGSAHYRRVGERGHVFIFDHKLNIVSGPIACKARRMDEVGIDKSDMEGMPEKTLFEATIMGEPCLCYHSFLFGYHVLAVQPCSESTYNRDAAMRSRTTTGSVVFLVLFFLIWLIVRRLVRSLNRIIASMERITAGDLNERVSVDDTIEFEQLSENTNMMVGRLKELISDAENRIVADLALAKAIQSSSLPTVFPAFPEHQEFDIHALMKTAREVGGDFYDFFFVGENKFAIIMADVAGKGIPAAMFMMRSKSALKNHASTGLPLAQVCYEVNNALCHANETQTFFTCWIGVIDLKTGVMTYVNAGHNHPLMRHNGGEFQFLECLPNLPMAAFENFTFVEEKTQLCPGDEVFLYTDGITEATSTSLELFGDDRLLDTFRRMTEDVASTSRSICEKTMEEVQHFAAGAEQSDDITMLSFKLRSIPGE